MPCKKCLSLVLCRHKLYVDCDVMYDWIKKIINKKNPTIKRKAMNYLNAYVFLTDGPANPSGSKRVHFLRRVWSTEEIGVK